MSVRNYHYTLHNNPEEHISHLHHDYVQLCALFELNFTDTPLWQIILLLYYSKYY